MNPWSLINHHWFDEEYANKLSRPQMIYSVYNNITNISEGNIWICQGLTYVTVIDKLVKRIKSVVRKDDDEGNDTLPRKYGSAISCILVKMFSSGPWWYSGYQHVEQMTFGFVKCIMKCWKLLCMAYWIVCDFNAIW